LQWLKSQIRAGVLPRNVGWEAQSDIRPILPGLSETKMKSQQWAFAAQNRQAELRFYPAIRSAIGEGCMAGCFMLCFKCSHEVGLQFAAM
jgi:hypothetical protein